MATHEGSHRFDAGQHNSTDSLNQRTDSADRTVDQSADHRVRAERATEVQEQRVLPAKTSAAAVFALIFGLSALLAVLTVILAPLALVLAVIGIVLAVLGMKMAKRVGVTGRGVAIGGLALSVIALVIAIALAIGVSTVLNNKSAVDRLDRQVQKMRDNLPAHPTVPTP